MQSDGASWWALGELAKPYGEEFFSLPVTRQFFRKINVVAGPNNFL